MRYESCAIVAVCGTAVAFNAVVNAVHSSSSHDRSAHRLAIFVNTWPAVAAVGCARGGAVGGPPAIETCAPSRGFGAMRLWGFGALRLWGFEALGRCGVPDPPSPIPHPRLFDSRLFAMKAAPA